MPLNFSFNDAYRVIDRVIDERIRQLTKSGAGIDYQWGTIAALPSAYTASVYLDPNTTDQSFGFRLENGLKPNLLDPVRVAIDKRGNKWVDAILNPTAGGILDIRNRKLHIDRLHIDSGLTDVSLTSTDNPLQIGSSNAANLVVDNNEIMARDNGVASDLLLNNEGGAIRSAAQLVLSRSGVSADTIDLTSTTIGNGIRIGGDVNLYRSAANVLKTDDAFTAVGTVTGSGFTVGNSSFGAGSIELRWNGGTPFIDFSNDLSIDYDARLILTGNDILQLQGASFESTSTHNTFWMGNVSGTSSDTGQALEIYQPTAGQDAFVSFHVSGDYAINFGFDNATNDLFMGGWSAGAGKYKVWSDWNRRSYMVTQNMTMSNGQGVTPDYVVNFPAGRFNATPVVMLTKQTTPAGSGSWIPSIRSISTTSCTIIAASTVAMTSDVTLTMGILAVQM